MTNKEYKFYSERNLPGQAAIEYLMTYGWMLVAVATIGTATFQTMGFECVPNVSGFEGEDLQVEDFGVDADNNYQIALANQGRNTVTLDLATIEEETSGEIDEEDFEEGELEIDPGGEVALEFEEGHWETNQDICRTTEISLSYDVEPLEDLQSTGEAVGPIERVPLDELADMVEIVEENTMDEEIPEDTDLEVGVEVSGEPEEGLEVYFDSDEPEGTTDSNGEFTLDSSNYIYEEGEDNEYSILVLDPDETTFEDAASNDDSVDTLEFEVIESQERPNNPTDKTVQKD